MVDASWYIVAVEPQAESAVVGRAKDVSVTAYYPTGRQLVRRTRRRTVVIVPEQRAAMAGYVFVHGVGPMHFDQFGRDYDGPDAVPRCIGWLSGANGPEPVAAAVVDEIKQREADGEFDVADKAGRYWAPRWLRAGAKARIINGAFKGMVGEIWRLTAKRKVALWVQMMGAPTLTECPIDWVARTEKTVARGSKASYP